MRRLAGGLAAGVFLALVLAAGAGAGVPVANTTTHTTVGPYASDFCGVPGTETDTSVEHFFQSASGAVLDNFASTDVFTAAATGNTLVARGASTTKSGAPVTNPDGTFSITTTETGLLLHFQVLNGPMLKAADGEPLRSAGFLTTTDTFDANGNFIDETSSFAGPHLFREGVDVCGSVIAYLTGS